MQLLPCLACLSIYALLVPAAVRASQPSPDEQTSARLALALASATHRPAEASPAACPCGCGIAGCKCTDGGCGFGSGSATKDRYTAALDRASRENKPVLVWVAETCPPCERAMPNYVHAHLASYDGDSTPRVLVAKPAACGEFTVAAKLPGIPAIEDIRAALAPKPTFLLPGLGGCAGGCCSGGCGSGGCGSGGCGSGGCCGGRRGRR